MNRRIIGATGQMRVGPGNARRFRVFKAHRVSPRDRHRRGRRGQRRCGFVARLRQPWGAKTEIFGASLDPLEIGVVGRAKTDTFGAGLGRVGGRGLDRPAGRLTGYPVSGKDHGRLFAGRGRRPGRSCRFRTYPPGSKHQLAIPGARVQGPRRDCPARLPAAVPGARSLVGRAEQPGEDRGQQAQEIAGRWGYLGAGLAPGRTGGQRRPNRPHWQVWSKGYVGQCFTSFPRP